MNIQAKTLLVAALMALPGLAAAQVSPAADDQSADMVVTASSQVPEEANCLRYTGSLVVASQNQRSERQAKGSSEATAQAPACNGSAGRSYSQDDLRRTGQSDIGRALQMLDPSVTVHH